MLPWAATGTILAIVAVSAAFLGDMRRAYERVRASSIVIASPYGDIEYKVEGAGPPVLVVHGSGGGHDQGELIAGAVLGDGFMHILPSRFRYLRSGLREGATWDDQAHAYAILPDEPGIERAAVVAMSQGGPSARLFAVLFPDRVSSLSLISCGVAASTSPDQSGANDKGDMLTAIFERDVLYWADSRLFRAQLMKLLGADGTVIAGLTGGQRRLLDDFIDYMNPAAPRSAGVTFDNTAQMPGERITAITAPTVIFHAADDTLQLFDNTAFAAATIPGARLVRFDSGGHFVIGTKQAVISAAVQQHILDHAEGPVP